MASKSAARRAWRVARGKVDPRCDYCGIVTSEHVPENHPQRATVEDIMPLSKGGSNNRSNWALACSACNQAKGAEERHPVKVVTAKRQPVKMGQPFTVTKLHRPTEMERRQAKRLAFHQHRVEEVERLARLARLPFTLYPPIPGVPDEAFR